MKTLKSRLWICPYCRRLRAANNEYYNNKPHVCNKMRRWYDKINLLGMMQDSEMRQAVIDADPNPLLQDPMD